MTTPIRPESPKYNFSKTNHESKSLKKSFFGIFTSKVISPQKQLKEIEEEMKANEKKEIKSTLSKRNITELKEPPFGYRFPLFTNEAR